MEGGDWAGLLQNVPIVGGSSGRRRRRRESSWVVETVMRYENNDGLTGHVLSPGSWSGDTGTALTTCQPQPNIVIRLLLLPPLHLSPSPLTSHHKLTADFGQIPECAKRQNAGGGAKLSLNSPWINLTYLTKIVWTSYKVRTRNTNNSYSIQWPKPVEEKSDNIDSSQTKPIST